LPAFQEKKTMFANSNFDNMASYFQKLWWDKISKIFNYERHLSKKLKKREKRKRKRHARQERRQDLRTKINFDIVALHAIKTKKLSKQELQLIHMYCFDPVINSKYAYI